MDKLKGKEKVIVWIANIVNPVIAGFLFYYSWKNKYPSKAKEANRISFMVIGIELVIYLTYKFLTSSEL